MAITATCSCGNQVTATDKHAGKRMTCPACGNPLDIPDPAKPPAAPPFERAVIERLDRIGGIGLMVARRLAVLCVLLFLLLASAFVVALGR